MPSGDQGQQFTFTDNPTVRKYAAIAYNICRIKSKRDSLLDKHFYEAKGCNVDYLEDRDAQIQRIIGKECVHPNAFLASTLGFNRMSWNKAYEKTMSQLGVNKTPKFCSLRTMLLFEKLKLLVIKYHERKK